MQVLDLINELQRLHPKSNVAFSVQRDFHAYADDVDAEESRTEVIRITLEPDTVVINLVP